MIASDRQSRTAQATRAAADLLRLNDWTQPRIDPEAQGYVAHVLVWTHWCIGALCFFQLVYRPYWGADLYLAYSVLFFTLMGFNGYLHYRLRSRRETTWRWILALLTMDVVVITVSAAISGGFSHYFFHLFYYPTVAMFAFTFNSLRLNLAWVTVVCLLYLATSVFAGDGLDLAAREEKPLLVRIFLMYLIVTGVALVSRFERTRWRTATERERALQQERVSFSQAVHDTSAQSAYMIGLGIDAARQVADPENRELADRLEATSRLSRTAIWQLRHPIDVGRIFEGRELGRTLDSHVSTFTAVTAVPADLELTGGEPDLPVKTRSALFSIAHNALTNSLRHAEATRVLVSLAFGEKEISLSVSDDGIGLPENYAERGHGFANMQHDAESLGGRLDVKPRGPLGGAAVTCTIPIARG